MIDPAGRVRRWVPRNLRDDGMVEASEVAHYDCLSLTQYVLASDCDALAAQARELVETAEYLADSWDYKGPHEIAVNLLLTQARAMLDAQGR